MPPEHGPFSFSVLVKEAKLPAMVLVGLLFGMAFLTSVLYFMIGAQQQKAALFILIFMTLLAIGITAFYLWQGFITVDEQKAVVVERFGQFHEVYYSGIHILLPLIDKPRKMKIRDPSDRSRFLRIPDIDLRERNEDLPAQMVITKDNLMVEVDSVVRYQIVDPKKAIYGVIDLVVSMEDLIKTSLRDVIGGLTLQQVLGGRGTINSELKQHITQTSKDWGIEVRDVGLQDVRPPKEYSDAVNKRQAAIASAEGEKQADIARAEGKKQAAMLLAEGEAAQINTYKDVDILVKMKYLEALEKIANGNATKVFIPFPNDPSQGGLFGNVMNLVAGAGEALASKDFNPTTGKQTPKSPSEGVNKSPSTTNKPDANKPGSVKPGMTRLNQNKPLQSLIEKKPAAPSQGPTQKPEA